MAASGCLDRGSRLDTTYYLNLFLDEVHSKLSLVGERLVLLEQNPSDAGAIDEVFREIHSFKGNASTVGFDELAEVAHEMETALAALRSGELTPEPALFRLLNRVLAALETRLTQLEEDEPGTFPASLLAELGAVTVGLGAQREPTPEQACPVASETPRPAAEGARRVRLTVTLDAACMIPSTRAFMVTTTLELSHTVLCVSPDIDTLESLPPGASFTVELRTDADDDALRAELADIGDVAAVTVEVVEAEPAPPVFILPAAAHEALLAASPGHVWVSRVRFDVGCAMPEARAALVTQALQANAEVLQTQLVPGALWLLLRTEQDENALRAAIGAVAEVREVCLQAPRSLGELVARAPEDASQAPGGPTGPAERSAARTVRVAVDRLSALVALSEQLRAAQQALATAPTAPEARRAAALAAELADQLHADVQALTRRPAELLLARYPRMVRELGHELGKEAELHVTGHEVLLDTALAEGLGDVLVHLLRNAVDHGLEAPEERRRAGKPPVGAVRLTVRQEPDALLLTVADDGRGLDPAAIRQAAVARGRLTTATAAAMATEDVVQLVFEPGFSTRQTVTRVSGRGVGLDAVRHKVEGLGGTLSLETHPGRGLTFRLRFPAG